MSPHTTSTPANYLQSTSEFRDKEGKAITFEQWARLFEDEEYRRVAYYTNLGGDFQVSTVWLGLVHGYGPSGPLIFETLVRVQGEEEQIYRYGTLAEALRSHERLCGVVDDNLENPTRMSLVMEED